MSFSNSQEDRVLIAHLQDLVDRAERNCMGCFSRFLDERQLFIAEKALKNRTDVNVVFWGGYENAQRKICCIFPEWAELDMVSVPIACITYKYRSNDKLSHRDFLGAFMSCGIQRETVGDIIIGENKTQAIVTDTIVPLLREITKVGRCGVKVTDEETFNMPLQQNFREISGTVSSLRIDSIAALSIKESREKTVRMIQQGRIQLNYEEVTSSSIKLAEGDIFVVKGFGKFRLKTVIGLSKKGRLHILIEQYH